MRKSQKLGIGIIVATLIVGTVVGHHSYATTPGVNNLVSVNNTGNGQGGDGNSPHDFNGLNQAVSANGKFVAFTSNATNLVANDTNGKADLFVRDLENNTTTRVDVSTSGAQANNGINDDEVAISSTGRYVVFSSLATNLIDGQTISTPQIYIRDMVTNMTAVVTQSSSGALANNAGDVAAVSSDGRFVVWEGTLETNLVSSETNTQSYYVYVTDLKDRTTKVLNHTPATGQYFAGGISSSCDGSFITFQTPLQLDPSDTDSAYDIYLVDMRNGMTITDITASTNTTASSQLATISCNGDYVTFSSKDTSLVTSGTVPADTNTHQYLYDRLSGSITLVDTSSSGTVANLGVNADHGGVDDQGNVFFYSSSSNLIDGHTMYFPEVYLKHHDTGVTELISRTPGGSDWSGATSVGGGITVSADGRTAVYRTGAASTTLLNSDTNGYGDVIASLTGL